MEFFYILIPLLLLILGVGGPRDSGHIIIVGIFTLIILIGYISHNHKEQSNIVTVDTTYRVPQLSGIN